VVHMFEATRMEEQADSFYFSIVPIFGLNAPLIFPIFLKRSLVFPLLSFSSIIKHCSLKKTFLSLLATSSYFLEFCVYLGVPFPLSLAFHFSSFFCYL